MAANVYRQDTADGNSHLARRAILQGRKASPETRMLRVNISMSREGKKMIHEKAKCLRLSFSAYLELSGSLYTPELLNH